MRKRKRKEVLKGGGTQTLTTTSKIKGNTHTTSSKGKTRIMIELLID